MESKKSIFSMQIFKNKKILIAVAVVLFLIVVLLYINWTPSTSKSDKTNNTSSEVADYSAYVEQRIETIVSSIKGIGSVNAFVHVSSSIEIIYAKDVNEEIKGEEIINKEETIVYEKDSNVTNAVIVTKKYPPIEGVLVVAEGADDEKLRIIIVNALSMVLGVNINKIEVLAG